VREASERIIGSNFTLAESDLGEGHFVGVATVMNIMKSISKQDFSGEMNQQIEQTVGEMTAYISIRYEDTTFLSNRKMTWSKDQLEYVDVHRLGQNVYKNL